MAKRFTLTEKWLDGWFLGLSQENKLIWIWVLDTCTPAGRWIKNFKMLKFCCDANITEEEFREAFKDKVIDKGDYYFIPDFLMLQYPRGLNSYKPAIISVREELIIHKLLPDVKQSLGNDYLMIKQSLSNDYLMIKDKEKERSKEKETTQDKNNIYIYQDIIPGNLEGERKEGVQGEKGKQTLRNRTTLSDEEWLEEIKKKYGKLGIGVETVKVKMEAWCLTNGKEPTRRRLINWLNREDRPLEKKNTLPKSCGDYFNEENVEKRAKEKIKNDS